MKTRKRSERIRLNKIEDRAIKRHTQVLIQLKQDTSSLNPKPRRRHRIEKESDQSRIRPDDKSQSVPPIVLGIKLPQNERKSHRKYKMQRIKKSSHIIQERTSKILLQHESRNRTEQSQISIYRPSNMHSSRKTGNQPVKSFITQQKRHKRKPILHKTATPPIVRSVHEKTQHNDLRPRNHPIGQTKNQQNRHKNSRNPNSQDA